MNDFYQFTKSGLYTGQLKSMGKSPLSNTLVPTVVEKTHEGERAFDIFSRLLKDRVIFMNTQVEANMAALIVAQMLFLESEDAKRDITLYVNSPGGHVTAGLAILRHHAIRET